MRSSSNYGVYELSFLCSFLKVYDNVSALLSLSAITKPRLKQQSDTLVYRFFHGILSYPTICSFVRNYGDTIDTLS
jgi:hypothetical protein